MRQNPMKVVRHIWTFRPHGNGNNNNSARRCVDRRGTRQQGHTVSVGMSGGAFRCMGLTPVAMQTFEKRTPNVGHEGTLDGILN
ncbi:unnamed protein product [Boreogadus saida]